MKADDRETDAPLDRSRFELGDARYDAFVRALDAPPAPHPRLKRLMADRSPWDA